MDRDEFLRGYLNNLRYMRERDFVKGYLKVTDALSMKCIVNYKYNTNSNKYISHYGADDLMAKCITNFLNGKNKSLPVSVIDAVQAGIVALSIDDSRKKNKVINLKKVWQKLDNLLI